MVDVGDVQGERPGVGQAGQRVEQTDAVRAAADAGDDGGGQRCKEMVLRLGSGQGVQQWISGMFFGHGSIIPCGNVEWRWLRGAGSSSRRGQDGASRVLPAFREWDRRSPVAVASSVPFPECWVRALNLKYARGAPGVVVYLVWLKFREGFHNAEPAAKNGMN